MDKMALNSTIILVAILLVTCTSMILASEKHWPDLSCHPAFDKDPSRQTALDKNRKTWKQCQSSSKQAKGSSDKTKKCDKICVLEARRLLVFYDNEAPYFDTSMMVNHLSHENGYTSGLGGPEAEKLMNKVMTGIRACADKHKDIDKIDEYGPCDAWNPFLSCIDSVYGCK